MTHILGEHTELVIATARGCQPNTHTPDQAKALIAAVLHCIDLAGGITQAARPRAASPAHPAFANRTRSTTTQSAPMNPVSRHYGSGHSTRPPSDKDSDYWRHEYQRVGNHFDRCEVVRRAANYLAGLVARDPKAPKGDLTDDDVNELMLNHAGWAPTDVAPKYHRTARDVVIVRIEAGRHPLTGQPWTPPDHNAFAAPAAREMRAAGLACVDIAASLHRNVNTIYAWTAGNRRAAA